MLIPCHAALRHVGYIWLPQNTLFVKTQAWKFVGYRGVSEIVSRTKYCVVTLFASGVVWGEGIQNVYFVQMSKYIFLDE
jgi:hypothetical protein